MVRGDVHAITLSRRKGHVQRGPRYAVIVQGDALLALSTIVICPTSRSALPASFHPGIDLNGEPTSVMCEMAGSVDASRLGDHVGHLTAEEMAAVDDALTLVLGLA